MKSDKIFLCEWKADLTDGYTDIPWPMVHEQVGHETVKWLIGRSHHDCQLIIEKGTGFSQDLIKLYAEFYDSSLRTEFALRFAK